VYDYIIYMYIIILSR